MDLKGAHVVLLGGTSGIGFATAAAAAGRGAEVTIVSSKPASVERALAALPDTARGQAVDLGDPARIQALFEGLGEFDHLVYTAGEPLSFMPVAEFDAVKARAFFGLRYFSALAAVHSAAPHIRAGGSITLTTGTASQRPGPGWAVAASICGAVEAMTRALAVELAPIRINAVRPGVTRSPIWSGLPKSDREQMYRDVGAALPVGRVGEVEDVAEGYLSLITQPFATGTILTLDGGALVS